MSEKKKCGVCGEEMEHKFFKGGFPPIWRCRRCEYAKPAEVKAAASAAAPPADKEGA